MDNNGRHIRSDRQARLLVVMHHLNQHRNGLKPKTLSSKCNVSTRTTYRDLVALEDDMGLRFAHENGRWILLEKCLPPLYFTLSEVLNIFLGVRQIAGSTCGCDPRITSVFNKLNSVAAAPLREQINKTLDWIHQQKVDERRRKVLADIADAWISQRKIRILYGSSGRAKARWRAIEPYFMQTVAAAPATYIIARCGQAKRVLMFKIERIEDTSPTDEPYRIPKDFDANQFLGVANGIAVEDDAKTVRLKFAPSAAGLVSNVVWQPSQKTTVLEDGSLQLDIKASDTPELRSWIMSWEDRVEVLAPSELRQEVADSARAMLCLYGDN
ncbi:MAG: WYL domain-containing transcriptional regulator [Chloroflexi bacterium]|nr:WYL domain-containing transcriptional regulator [Chloroflexota bacterium]